MSDTVARETATQPVPAAKALPDLSSHGLTLEVVAQPTFGGAQPAFSFRIHGPGIETAETFLRELGFRYNPVTGHWSSSAALNVVRMADFLPNGTYEKGVKSISAADYAAPIQAAPGSAATPAAEPAPRASRTVVPPPPRRAVPPSPQFHQPPASELPPAGRPGAKASSEDARWPFGGVAAPNLPPVPVPPAPQAAPVHAQTPNVAAVGTGDQAATIHTAAAEALPAATDATRARASTRRRFQDIGPSLFDLPEFTRGDLPPPTRATAPRQPAAATPAAYDLNNSVILSVILRATSSAAWPMAAV